MQHTKVISSRHVLGVWSHTIVMDANLFQMIHLVLEFFYVYLRDLIPFKNEIRIKFECKVIIYKIDKRLMDYVLKGCDYFDFFFFFCFIAVDVLDESTQYEKQKQIPLR